MISAIITSRTKDIARVKVTYMDTDILESFTTELRKGKKGWKVELDDFVDTLILGGASLSIPAQKIINRLIRDKKLKEIYLEPQGAKPIDVTKSFLEAKEIALATAFKGIDKDKADIELLRALAIFGESIDAMYGLREVAIAKKKEDKVELGEREG
jgi:hypothetical protein